VLAVPVEIEKVAAAGEARENVSAANFRQKTFDLRSDLLNPRRIRAENL
jgi:hypothetical protein